MSGTGEGLRAETRGANVVWADVGRAKTEATHVAIGGGGALRAVLCGLSDEGFAISFGGLSDAVGYEGVLCAASTLGGQCRGWSHAAVVAGEVACGSRHGCLAVESQVRMPFGASDEPSHSGVDGIRPAEARAANAGEGSGGSGQFDAQIRVDVRGRCDISKEHDPTVGCRIPAGRATRGCAQALRRG